MKKKENREPDLRHWLDRFEALRRDCPRHSARALCRLIALPYSTLRRWRARHRAGLPVRRRPGPAKSGPLPFAAFRAALAGLVHRARRTRGSGGLFARFRQAVSRRRLADFVRRLRQRAMRRLRGSFHRVAWHQANLAWAIDAFHLRHGPADPGAVVVIARDLASHFHFEPLVLPAESAAANLAWLDRLFSANGPPLILKRDNGSPFNTPEIDALLARRGILPLNSPVRKPSYNGAIEHAVGSSKRAVLPVLDPALPVPPVASLAPLVRAAILLHNAGPRRSLAGRSPAEAYHSMPKPTRGAAERRRIFCWTAAKSAAILSAMHENGVHHARDPAFAWRAAVVAWLRCQHLITVSKETKPSPSFDSSTGP